MNTTWKFDLEAIERQAVHSFAVQDPDEIDQRPAVMAQLAVAERLQELVTVLERIEDKLGLIADRTEGN